MRKFQPVWGTKNPCVDERACRMGVRAIFQRRWADSNGQTGTIRLTLSQDEDEDEAHFPGTQTKPAGSVIMTVMNGDSKK